MEKRFKKRELLFNIKMFKLMKCMLKLSKPVIKSLNEYNHQKDAWTHIEILKHFVTSSLSVIDVYLDENKNDDNSKLHNLRNLIEHNLKTYSSSIEYLPKVMSLLKELS